MDELFATDMPDNEFEQAVAPQGYWCLFGLCWPWYVWAVSATAIIILLFIAYKKIAQ